MTWNTTWRKLLLEKMSTYGETWDDVEAYVTGPLPRQAWDEEYVELGLDGEFNHVCGSRCGDEFTVWTKKRVYFPATYDGREWVASVSRHPDGVPTRHVGGG